MYAKLSTIYPLKDIQRLRVPRSIHTKITTGEPLVFAMDKFHSRELDNLQTTVKGGSLTFTTTPRDPEKMSAVISHSTGKVFGFGRSVLSNFMLDLKDAANETKPIQITCSEQLFAAYKTLFVNLDHPEASEANLTECMNTIFTGKTPRDFKKAGNSLCGFRIADWDEISSMYMFYSILIICMANEKTFNRYLEVANMCADMVYETNIDDEKWGIRSSTENFVDKIAEAFDAEGQEFDLLKAAAAVAPGENKLGKILVQFFDAIRGESFENFVAAVGPIQFMEVVDDAVFFGQLRAPKRKMSEDPEVENKRSCSCNDE